MTGGQNLDEWWKQLRAAARDRSEAIADAYQQLDNAGLLGRVTLHQYLCKKDGRPLARVIRLGDLTVARTADNKMSRGLNRKRSVESARRTKTLDGDRHWPGLVYDVGDLAQMGPDVGLELSCRHGIRMLPAVDILTTVESVQPGHPAKPTLI